MVGFDFDGKASSHHESKGTDSTPSAGKAPKESPLLRARPDICEHMTDAQLQVMSMLLQGLSAPQIAKQVHRSVNTVHDHIKAIYRKLGVNSRVQLVLLFASPK